MQKEVTETKEGAADRSPLNQALLEVDSLIQNCGVTDPQHQLAVLNIAVCLAARRVLAKYNATDRGRRMKLVKGIVADIDSKLREYARQTGPATDALVVTTEEGAAALRRATADTDAPQSEVPLARRVGGELVRGEGYELATKAADAGLD